MWDEIRDIQATEARPVRHGNGEPDGADKGKARAADFGDDFGLFGDDTSYADPCMFADV